MIIKVTKQHILKGKRCSPKYCPIALAIKSAGYTDVSVKTYISALSPSGNWIYFPTSIRCRNFIEEFDQGGRKTVKPFGFLLRS